MHAEDARGKIRPGRDTVAPQMRPPVSGTGRRLDTFPWRARGLAPSRVPALARTGGGDALETEARLAAEQELAAGAGARTFDLSAVRIHSDAEAGALTRAMRAAAVTVGDDVYFATGRFRPDTRPGRALIAHELTHVEQQRRDGGLRPQLSPDPPAQQPQSAGGAAAGSLQLPWSGQGSSLFEVISSGIRFLVAIPAAKEKEIRAVIPKLSAQILSDNKRIRTPVSRVTTCLIADDGAEFVRWQGTPTILLNLPNANTETVAHEMGHATFEALADPAATGGGLMLPEQVRALLARQEAAADREIRLRFASLYVRLGRTRTRDNSTVPVGLDMVDPARWAPGKWGEEHPSENVDEFFASAKAAYQIDRKALQSSIDRAAQIDRDAGTLGKEMIDLLDVVYRNPAILKGALTPEEREAAEAVLPHGPDQDIDVETPASHNALLSWLIHPSTRPLVRPAPQATKPSSVPATKQP